MAIKFLSEIIQTIRERGDFRNPIKFTDAIITKEAQAAFSELHQLIAETCQGFFDIYGNVTTRSTADFVALPSDAWVVRAIDILDITGCPTPLRQVGIEDRNRYGVTRGRPCEYRLTARGIDLYPPPDAAYTLRVLYTPSAPSLSAPIFVGASSATFDSTTATVTTPSDVAAGDVMMIVIAGGLATGIPDGWHSALTLTSTVDIQTCMILRRTADGSEESTYDIEVDGACAVAMLVYRNIDPSINFVDSEIIDVDASTSFPCPTLDAEAVSDMYIGIASTTDGTGASITQPFGSTERIDVTQDSVSGSDRQFAAFDLQPGVIGPTGAKTALASSARSGIAVSLLLKVNPFRDFFNGWDEYIIYGAMLRLSSQEEAMRGDWQVAQDRARVMAVRGASQRRSAEPQLIPLCDDGGLYGW